MDFVTIDGKNSKDLDDAVRVERRDGGYRVEVAVADVASAVPIGGDVDRAARRSGFSSYRVDQAVRPMLPTALSEDSCSLLAGRRREAVVVSIDLDAAVDVASVAVERRQIEVARRYDHEGALRAIEGGYASGPMLREAMALSEALMRRRQAGGAMSFCSPERGLVTNEEGRILNLGRTARAYLLVQELMILVNAALGMRLADRGVQILYRNHRAKPTAGRQSLLDDIALIQQGALNPMIFESRRGLVMERATLGVTAEGHYAVNVPVYAWFTSPIRRYADLVNHRILLADLAGRPSPYSAAELAAIADELNARYREESERTAEEQKRRAVGVAIEAAASGSLRALDGSGFAQAVKVVAAGADFGEAFLAEARRRSATGELTGKDLYRLMAAEGPTAERTRAVAADHFVARPESASAVVNYAQSVLGWTMSAEDVCEGVLSDGTPAFAVRVTAGAPDAGAEAVSWGNQKRVATQRALASILIRMCGVEPPEAWGSIPVIRAKWVSADKTVSGDPKGALYSLCQKRRWSPPGFDVERSGPDHAPKFVCTASVVGETGRCEAKGEGANRRTAEAAAAAALIADLALERLAVA